jgi:hypothetical protein
MKRRSHKSHKNARPAASRAVSYGGFAGAAAAALLAASPVNITVTFGPEPRTVVASQADVPNPVCQATLTR